MRYEIPEILEIGTAEATILGPCGCCCDCCGQQCCDTAITDEFNK